jgi:sulfur-carrier protein adenylyltransferase/sulfurtransferase
MPEQSFSFDRYNRQMYLPDFGNQVQQKLSLSKVLIIGVGGLGCPALQYLSAMGVGSIGLIDGDTVSISNLHRQVLYTTQDIGKQKVEAAKHWVAQQNPAIDVQVYPFYVNESQAPALFSRYDVVLDCTDRTDAHQLIHDACANLQKPLVYASVYRYEGQLAVFHLKPHTASYHDIFPFQSASTANIPTCAEAGVYPITCGVIGMMQAGEAIKILTGHPKVLQNELLLYNALSQEVCRFRLVPKKNPGSIPPPHQTAQKLLSGKHEINADEFEQFIVRNDVQLVDIRQLDEQPRLEALGALCIPVNELQENVHQLDHTKHIILFCHSGIRTQYAIDLLQDEYDISHVAHLKGGIVKWLALSSSDVFLKSAEGNEIGRG